MSQFPGFANFGWIEDRKGVEEILTLMPRPIFGSEAAHLADSGKGVIALLYQAVVKVRGSFPVDAQTIGDCVAHGYGCGVNTLNAVQIALQNVADDYRGDTATEVIYAGARTVISRPSIADGAVGAYAAQYISRYGTLLRAKYGDIDLTRYDGTRARAWGRRGIPDELRASIAHPVQTASLVHTYEQARDAIANGYPVPVCSNQGFAMSRDEKGFARASGHWGHCMCFIAVDDADARPGLLCMNSWGPDWISGPKRHDQPDGSFWVDAEIANRMMASGESFALSHFEGFARQVIGYDMFA